MNFEWSKFKVTAFCTVSKDYNASFPDVPGAAFVWMCFKNTQNPKVSTPRPTIYIPKP